MKSARLTWLLSLILWAVFLGQSVQCDDARSKLPDIRIVLLVADGLEAPPDAHQKIAASAEYAEQHLVKWMRHWGYPPARDRILTRDDDGRVRVLEIQGLKPPEEYTKAYELLKEVWGKTQEKYKLPRNYPVWWIWVYKGDPPVRLRDYRGSGNLPRGGWAVVNYENRPGEIKLDKEMAEGFLHDFTLKGCIHELGHAMGLFHIGPLTNDPLGNTLMGPRTDPFRADTTARANENRVYLSEAAAAILWKHFLFSGTTRDRSVLPSVSVNGFNARYDSRGRRILVSGTLRSNMKAHSVVLIDEAPPRQENYWRKTYVARLDEQGNFGIQVTQPSRTSGTFRLMFCFENGALTGDGKTRDLKTAFVKRYAASGNRYRFEK